MKTRQLVVAATVVALAALGGCAQGDKAQGFGAQSELSKLTLGFGGGPPAAKQTPLAPGQVPIDRAGRSTLGSITMPSMTTSEIGPRAHGEQTGGAAPKNPITQRK